VGGMLSFYTGLDTLAAAGGGYAAGYVECGNACGRQDAWYGFLAGILSALPNATGNGENQERIPEKGTAERADLDASGKVLAVTPDWKNPLSVLEALLGNGYSHVWWTGDKKFTDVGGRYGVELASNVSYAPETYATHYFRHFLWNNCATRFDYYSPGAYYNAIYGYSGNSLYWWGHSVGNANE